MRQRRQAVNRISAASMHIEQRGCDKAKSILDTVLQILHREARPGAIMLWTAYNKHNMRLCKLFL